MNKIDKLIEQARRQLGGGLFPTVAMVRRDAAGRYVLDVHLWNGIDGSGEQIVTTSFATFEAAQAAYSETLRRYPQSKRSSPVLINMDVSRRGCDL